MKRTLKTTLVIAAGLISTASFAQVKNHRTIDGTTPFSPTSSYRTWSIGFNAGVLDQSNIFGLNRDGFDVLYSKFGYSGYIKRQITPSFGLKAQYLGGKVVGKNENAQVGAVGSFEAQIDWSAALSAEFTLGNINWRFVRSTIKPYAALGLGLLNNKTTASFNLTPPPVVTPPNTVNYLDISAKSGETRTKLYVPLDLGFKIALSKGVNLDLGYQLNWANQHFDGAVNGEHKNDLFSYAHAGLEFALGSKSKPYLGNSNPAATLAMQYDVLKKEKDELVASNAALAASNKDLSAQVSAISNELKDDDGDGVANKFDKCPGTPQGVKVDGSGCEIVFVNQTKVIEKVIITEADKQIVAEAIKNLEFDLGKATIRPTSYSSLDRVADLLKEKNFKLRLAGYTDNTGSLAVNNRISKERAESVKAYLVSKGANADNIEALGFGPKNPIASNKTAEGRQLNRRVEFNLHQ